MPNTLSSKEGTVTINNLVQGVPVRAMVLLSGGVDSTTLLGSMVAQFGKENVRALSLYYGQKHSKEMEYAAMSAEYYGVELIRKDMSSAFDFEGGCSLLKSSDKELPKQSYAKQLAAMGGEGVVETYVPFRNGLMLSFATAIAIQMGATYVCYGAHADDATGGAYPDCTESFVQHLSRAIYTGSGNNVSLLTPYISKNKAAIVAEGLKLGVPYELTWSCYAGEQHPCGECGTCIDRAEAFRLNEAVDPLLHPQTTPGTKEIDYKTLALGLKERVLFLKSMVLENKFRIPGDVSYGDLHASVDKVDTYIEAYLMPIINQIKE